MATIKSDTLRLEVLYANGEGGYRNERDDAGLESRLRAAMPRILSYRILERHIFGVGWQTPETSEWRNIPLFEGEVKA